MTEDKKNPTPEERPRVKPEPGPAAEAKPEPDLKAEEESKPKPETEPAPEAEPETKPAAEEKPAAGAGPKPEAGPKQAEAGTPSSPEAQKKNKKINRMSLKAIEIKLRAVKEKMGNLQSHYAKQLLKQKEALSKEADRTAKVEGTD